MRCPACDYPITEGVDFCIRCGAELDRIQPDSAMHTERTQIDGEVPYREYPLYPDRIPAENPVPSQFFPEFHVKKKGKAPQAIAVAIILLSVSVFGFLYIALYYGDAFEPDEYIIYGDGAVYSGVIKIESDPEDLDPYDGEAKIILTSGPYSVNGYRWKVTPIDYLRSENVSGGTASSITSTSGNNTLNCALNPGLYKVDLRVNGKTYTGTFALEGEVVRDYSWTYFQIVDNLGGTAFKPSYKHDFQIEFSFLYGECISSLVYDGLRGRILFSDAERIMNVFVSDSNAITIRLESMLRGAFDDKSVPYNFKGSDGFHYASYLLAFVQQVFEYEHDPVLYGTEEYWAFPAETIMRGQGDCEDTSFLCAALFKAAGFDTVIGLVPGHAMAGINLPGETIEDRTNSYIEVTPINYLIYEDIDGKRFYACETTYPTQFPIGYTNIIHTEELDNGEIQKSELWEWLPGQEYASATKTYGFYEVADF